MSRHTKSWLCGNLEGWTYLGPRWEAQGSAPPPAGIHRKQRGNSLLSLTGEPIEALSTLSQMYIQTMGFQFWNVCLFSEPGMIARLCWLDGPCPVGSVLLQSLSGANLVSLPDQIHDFIKQSLSRGLTARTLGRLKRPDFSVHSND